MVWLLQECSERRLKVWIGDAYREARVGLDCSSVILQILPPGLSTAAGALLWVEAHDVPAIPTIQQLQVFPLGRTGNLSP